jgi:hypothetical protein
VVRASVTRRIRKLEAGANAPRAAGAIPAASTFSEHVSTDDKWRLDTSKLADTQDVTSLKGSTEVRQIPTANGGTRPVRATESATNSVNDDPDLAFMVAAWPDLPDTVRAGILAMASGLEHLTNSI